MLIQLNWCRNRDSPSVAAEFNEEPCQTVGGTRVERTNWHHIDDLAVEKFYPGIRLEKAGLGHSMVLVDRETVSGQHSHEANLEEGGRIRKSCPQLTRLKHDLVCSVFGQTASRQRAQ
jgi:hypothetical protein